MAQEHNEAALRIIRHLTGGRFTWPPVEVRDLYPLRTNKVLLRGQPVRRIASVKDFETGEDLPYTRLGRYLEFPPEVACRRGLRVDVVFEYGSQPGPTIQRAIDRLAAELVLADTDPSKCKLPDRVTQVSRQGVSYTYMDPMTIVERGRTGIFEIDLVLQSQGSPKRRAGVYSTEYPPPDRLEVTSLPDPNPAPEPAPEPAPAPPP